MFLRELAVAGRRAIESATLELDLTTALIGENDVGLTSLLGALELVLGPDAPARVPAADFHRRRDDPAPAGPLAIALTFEERTPGEWSGPAHAVLERSLPRERGKPRQLVLEVRAEVPRDGSSSELVWRVRGARDDADVQELALHVRRMNPLIRVSGSQITGHGATDRVGGERTRVKSEIARLVDRILAAADDLLLGRSLDPEARLHDGFLATRELMMRKPEHVDPGAGGLVHSVREILGDAPIPNAAAPWREGRTTAERLGVLLLIAAVLRRMPAGLAPGCEPIWVIEEPEAHLHPMTLAGVARLLERIRWQKIVTTHSGELLARLPLGQIRRLVRIEGRLHVYRVRPKTLSREDLRRVGYHLRAQRGVAMFARVWLLVEGESEYWILPQVAQVLGHGLDLAGVVCLEYAQSGLEALLRTARELGIEWHLLADGDAAGKSYVATARKFVRHGEERERLTLLRERDIEHCLWHDGYEEVLMSAAGLGGRNRRNMAPRHVIQRAVKRHSKPGLALLIVEAIAKRGPQGVPAPLVDVIEACHRLSQRASEPVAVNATRVRVGGRPVPSVE